MGCNQMTILWLNNLLIEKYYSCNRTVSKTTKRNTRAGQAGQLGQSTQPLDIIEKTLSLYHILD